MRQVLIINQKIEEAEEIAHNLGETKAENHLRFINPRSIVSV